MMCIAITKKGTQCTFSSKHNDGRCTRHHKLYAKDAEPKEQCVTITFGDVAENHVGMQKIGEMRDEGMSPDDLKLAKGKFEAQGYTCILYALSRIEDEELKGVHLEPAYFLVVKKFVGDMTDKLLNEQLRLNWDTKAKMRGRVVNKHARYNLCYSDSAQEANFEEGKGTVIAYKDVPLLSQIRSTLDSYLGEKARELNAEGNLYHDVSKCGIGWHGDAERRIVVAIRLGKSMPLAYQWYLQSKPIGPRMGIDLHHGDMYIMSEKATGFDWKKRKVATLRHAAGCKKYLALKR